MTETFDLSKYVVDAAGDDFDERKISVMVERWTAISKDHEVQQIDLCYFGLRKLNLGIRAPYECHGRLTGDLNLMKSSFDYVDDCDFPLDMYRLPFSPEDLYEELFCSDYQDPFFDKPKRNARRRKQDILEFWRDFVSILPIPERANIGLQTDYDM